MQKVEVPKPHKRRLVPGHQITRLKQRLIVALPVVCDQDIEVIQMCLERRQNASLFGILTHEELANFESLLSDPANTNQKSVRASSSGQACGFRVQECPPRWGRSANVAVPKNSKQVMGKIRQRTHVGRTMALMRGKQAFRLEMLSKLVLYHLSLRPLLDEPAS